MFNIQGNRLTTNEIAWNNQQNVAQKADLGNMKT